MDRSLASNTCRIEVDGPNSLSYRLSASRSVVAVSTSSEYSRRCRFRFRNGSVPSFLFAEPIEVITPPAANPSLPRAVSTSSNGTVGAFSQITRNAIRASSVIIDTTLAACSLVSRPPVIEPAADPRRADAIRSSASASSSVSPSSCQVNKAFMVHQPSQLAVKGKTVSVELVNVQRIESFCPFELVK